MDIIINGQVYFVRGALDMADAIRRDLSDIRSFLEDQELCPEVQEALVNMVRFHLELTVVGCPTDGEFGCDSDGVYWIEE